MVCEKFKKMDDFERVYFMAKLLHAVQSDDELFKYGEEIIKLGLYKGVFDDVKFGHEIHETEPQQSGL